MHKLQPILKKRPITIWLTGLSGSGKTTLANGLNKKLIENGFVSYVLDGDNLRLGLCSDLGFSQPDRSENVRRASEVANLMNDAGLIVIAAFISPYIHDREVAKSVVGRENFFELYVSTPKDVCQARDPKGLYQKANLGLIKEFTGLSAPYEAPQNPWLSINTEEYTLDQAVEIIFNKLKIII